MRKRNLLTSQIHNLSFGTSVFHAYVHEWACQVAYNPRFNSWWGLSDGECLERLWSFLSKLVSPLRVSTRLHRLTSIQVQANYHSEQLLESSAQWLSNKLKNAKEVGNEAKRFLDTLYQTLNPHFPEQHQNYTNEFLEEQWVLEKQYHRTANVTLKNSQLQLGGLLCLQDKLDAAWGTTALTPQQALARATACSTLTEQIRTVRERLGTYYLTDRMTQEESELLVKVWHTKTEVRRRFLALIEEKQPLIRVRRAGETTTLGTWGQQKLIESLRKHAEKIRSVLNSYNNHVRAYVSACPDRPPLPEMEYSELLALQYDDNFWNDGIFTNANEPWAIDEATKKGIRQLAYLKRSIEEQRRLGWETRRAMRWAIKRHQLLKTALQNVLRLLRNPEALPIPQDIQTLVEHAQLVTLPSVLDRLKVAKLVIHAAYIKILNIQLAWHPQITQVLNKTTRQPQDGDILQPWNSQMSFIYRFQRMGLLSGVPGDICEGVISDTALELSLEIPAAEPLPLDHMPADDEDEENDDDDQDQQENDLEDALATDLLLSLGTSSAL
ncbi:hypothetical protein PTTG_26331 [Puccinia triticina 1-1 BBBD Race 1]|uniref:Uncharacterized protein n=1 Tax=Puccinia triticina (isolate 1-1 / race 1 (BBBD)) TaxID=630390 RepID=A0A180GUW0_PUCT1|nr:hypothetical protein PTTG_26331 [Puccinia triticina 1-1 BBBD Race 1]